MGVISKSYNPAFQYSITRFCLRHADVKSFASADPANHRSFMNQSATNQQAPQPIVFWILWFAILSGLFIMQFLVGGGVPKKSGQAEEPLLFPLIASGAAAASLFVRFVLIPKHTELSKKLPLMLVGLALAESIGILGMLVVPSDLGQTRLFMLGLSIVCVVLSAPTYAKNSIGGSPFRN